MQQTRKYPGFGHAVLLCLMVVALQSILIMPFVVLDMIFKLSMVRHPLVLATVNILSIGLTIFLSTLIGRVSLRDVLVLKPIPMKLLLPLLITLCGAAIVLSELDNFLRALLPVPGWVARIFAEVFNSTTNPVGAFFVLVIVAPITEEPLMRGLILRGFLTRYGVAKAIVLSALLFGALHMNPWQFVSASGLGLLFGWWYVRTRSLVPCLLGHALTNGLVFANPYLPFNIPGFNEGDPLTAGGFQPVWFDALGIALVSGGCWLFLRMSEGVAPPTLPPPLDETGPVPPMPPPLPGERIPPGLGAP